MALADTIAAIIARSKVIEICDSLHDVQISTTEEQLITAGLPLVVYAYQTGIIDDTLLADFDESLLNAAGIYTTGSFSLTNPVDEVYILKTAVVEITIDGNNKAKINVMGDSEVTVIANDNAYVTLKVYKSSSLELTVNDNALVNLGSRDMSEINVVQNNSSVLHISGTDNSIIDLVSNDTSYTLANMFNNSALTYELLDTAAIKATKFQKATITDNSSV